MTDKINARAVVGWVLSCLGYAAVAVTVAGVAYAGSTPMFRERSPAAPVTYIVDRRSDPTMCLALLSGVVVPIACSPSVLIQAQKDGYAA